MKALDTNVLVRFLVKDDETKPKKYTRYSSRQRLTKITFMSLCYLALETIWVLDSVYEIPRKEILDSINEILLMPILKFEAQPTIQRFIFLAGENKIDLSDVLIACAAKISGCERILTFDKRASKFELFELIKT